MNSRSPQKGVGHLVNADSRTRTCDLGFMNPSLWPAELYRRLPAGRGVTQGETEDTNPPGDWKETRADQLVSAIGEPLVELWSVPLVQREGMSEQAAGASLARIAAATSPMKRGLGLRGREVSSGWN